MVKTTILMILIIPLMVAFTKPNLSAAAESTSSLAVTAEETLKTIKSYLAEKKDDALKHGQALLAKTDTEIEKLEADAAKASGETRKAYDQELKSLKQKRAEASKKLDELANASTNSWDSAKQGFAEAYKALYDAYKEALAKFE